MIDVDSPKSFWERKIIEWEESRYSDRAKLDPLAWTVRGRFFAATEILRQRLSKQDRVLELACGSGWLAENILGYCSRYHGIDIASVAIERARARITDRRATFLAGDILEGELPACDVAVFLGLTDWLRVDQLEKLFGRLKCDKVFFSYTEAGPLNPYRLYRRISDPGEGDSLLRARAHGLRTSRELLRGAGFEIDLIQPAKFLNPGGLIWAHRL